MRRVESRDGFHAQIEILRATCDRLVTDISHMTVSRDHYRTLAENLEYGLQHASAARDDFATVAERTRAAYEHVRSEAQRLEAELIRVGAARDETARQLSIMERSTSWRLTWPLRALVTALRRPTAGRQ